MPPGNVAPYAQLSGPFSLREQYTGQPARIHKAATQAFINSLISQVVKLDTVTYDGYASSFNTASNGFVPPATGYYDIKGAMAISGSITNYIFSLIKNGVEVARFGQNNQAGGANGAYQLNGSDLVFGTPADLFTLGLGITGAATLFSGVVGTAGTFLTAQQVA